MAIVKSPASEVSLRLGRASDENLCSIGQVVPMPDAPAPLPMCRELWQELRRCRASATIPEVSDEMLDRLCERIIDAKVRPLVEALEQISNLPPLSTPDAPYIARDALRAAGAE